MRLEHLHINLCGYGPNAGKYVGQVKFESEYGTVEAVLSPELSVRVLEICADALVKNAQDMAQQMTGNIIEQVRGTLPASVESES